MARLTFVRASRYLAILPSHGRPETAAEGSEMNLKSSVALAVGVLGVVVMAIASQAKAEEIELRAISAQPKQLIIVSRFLDFVVK